MCWKGECVSHLNNSISRVQETIDKATTATERVHKAIMNLPLDIIEKVAPLEGLTKSVRKIQDSIVGGVYDIIRTANSEVGNIAQDLLKKAETPSRHHVRHAPGRHS